MIIGAESTADSSPATQTTPRLSRAEPSRSSTARDEAAAAPLSARRMLARSQRQRRALQNDGGSAAHSPSSVLVLLLACSALLPCPRSAAPARLHACCLLPLCSGCDSQRADHSQQVDDSYLARPLVLRSEPCTQPSTCVRAPLSRARSPASASAPLLSASSRRNQQRQSKRQQLRTHRRIG